MARNPPPLSSSASRALPFIESGLARGLSTSQLQSTLSAAGLGVRRTDMLSAVRYLKDIQLAGDRLKYVRYDYKPDPRMLPNARTRQLREYSFRVKVSGYNPATGLSEDRFFQVSTKELLTRGEIEEIGLGYSVDTEVYTPFEPENVELISASKASGFSTL